MALLARLTRRMLLALLLPGLACAATREPAPVTKFRIGVAPHSSARVILEMYQPLREYLESALKQPVEIVTAPDFTEYARRAMAQQYDIAITTGHQARLLQTDANYRELLTYSADFKSIAVVAGNSRYQTPADLAGTKVYGLSPSSLVTIWGQHWLQRNAVPDTTMHYVSASDSVVHLLLKGEGSAGFVSLANYQNMPAAIRAQMRVMAESLPMAGRVYMLNARHAARRDAILAELWAFAQTEPAKQYFARHQLGGYRALEPRELVAMEPYANEVRQELQRSSKTR